MRLDKRSPTAVDADESIPVEASVRSFPVGPILWRGYNDAAVLSMGFLFLLVSALGA